MGSRNTIARPYAKAVFAEALQAKAIPAWAQLLQTAAAAVRDKQFASALRNPCVSRETRLNILLDVCASVLNDSGRNFFKLLSEYNRLEVLPEIAELFETYRIEHEKTASVQIFSVAPLNETEKQNLAQALEKRLQRAVTLSCEIDSSLIGGLVIQAGDWVLDGSVKGKLARLRAELVD